MAAEEPASERKIFSVAAITRRLVERVEEFPGFWVEGEVSELRRQDGWGTVYWTLKDLDGSSSLRTQMFRTAYDRLPEPLSDGQRVQIFGRLQAFQRTGEVSLRAYRIEPAGLGSLLAQLERRKARLAADGLFREERKRPLPRFPRLVGLICGRDAAAKHDVVTNAFNRYPPVRFCVRECAVQGPGAPAQLIRALQELDAIADVDVIVLARGGGSLEDLAAFSDEELCRAIAACGTPVVSAIGHEQDSPLSDLVADLRASTPTQAARAIVPDAARLAAECAGLAVRAHRAVERRIGRERESLAARIAHPALARPSGFLDLRRSALDDVRRRLSDAQDRALERAGTSLAAAGKQLRALGPGATLERGYAIVLGRDGHTLSRAGDAAIGDPLEIRLARGALAARVEEVHP